MPTMCVYVLHLVVVLLLKLTVLVLHVKVS